MLFDGRDVELPKEFKPLPPGKYYASIKDAKVEPTQAGGKKLSVTFKIIQGDYEKREVYQNFWLEHSNPDAVKNGKQQLKLLVAAVGLGDLLTDVSQLHGKKVTITTKNEKKEDKTYTRATWYEKCSIVDNDSIPF